MPEISVQGVRTVHGYGISAEDTFWTKQGVLHSGSLRDSLDEQTVADIIACVLNKNPIQRSKAALNKIYDSSQKDYEKFESLLGKYGEDYFRRDFLCFRQYKTNLRPYRNWQFANCDIEGRASQRNFDDTYCTVYGLFRIDCSSQYGGL